MDTWWLRSQLTRQILPSGSKLPGRHSQTSVVQIRSIILNTLAKISLRALLPWNAPVDWSQPPR